MNNSVVMIGAAFVILSFLPRCKSRQQKVIEPSSATNVSNNNSTPVNIAEVVRLAEAFKSTLQPEQLTLLQLTYSKADAVKWSNFPQGGTRTKRVGIGLGTLTPVQLSAAQNLLKALLAQRSANEGYDELEGLLAADDYFGQTLGKTSMFGSGNFYMAFLGTPSNTALWELQFGGHHLAVSNTYDGGKLIGGTPSFRGVEPIKDIPANGRSYQPMQQEQAAFAKIIGGLSDAEKGVAKLTTTFGDILLGPGKDGAFPTTKQGVKISSLNSGQQQQILKAMELYVADLDEATAKQVMANYSSELANTYVAYSGSGTMNNTNDYIRIDGPGVWIEYSAQPSRDIPGTTHPHSVWRDRKMDYGGK